MLVFLRILEYYSVILILTTNRVGQFDEAVLSRTHTALYTNLNEGDTLKVWKKNIQKLKLLSESRNPTIKYNKHDVKSFRKTAMGKGTMLEWSIDEECFPDCCRTGWVGCYRGNFGNQLCVVDDEAFSIGCQR